MDLSSLRFDAVEIPSFEAVALTLKIDDACIWKESPTSIASSVALIAGPLVFAGSGIPFSIWMFIRLRLSWF